MLTIHPATAPPEPPPEERVMGLALAGGGPLGGIYEIGALLAMDEALEGIDFNRLDVYVGVSSGALIASSLVNRIDARQLRRIFLEGDSIRSLFDPDLFFRPALSEYLKRAASVPELFASNLLKFVFNPLQFGLLESAGTFQAAMPTGLFNSESIHEFFERIYSEEGRTNDFRELERKLYLMAVDLNTGEPVTFGAAEFDHVPISRALQASSALPGLYPPVEIEGRYYVDGVLKKTLHVSAALDEGARLVLCINPLVPFNANLAAEAGRTRHANLLDGGLPVVLSQTFRTLIHSRMEVGMGRYKRTHREADVLLFEPNREDPSMFFSNVFSFANRRRVCEHAYWTTLFDLEEHRKRLEPILARHGLAFSPGLKEMVRKRRRRQRSRRRTRVRSG